jgi:hypothetical protein
LYTFYRWREWFYLSQGYYRRRIIPLWIGRETKREGEKGQVE